MNKKLIIILTISIICSLGLGLLVGYFIPIDKANSKTLSSNKDGNVSSFSHLDSDCLDVFSILASSS